MKTIFKTFLSVSLALGLGASALAQTTTSKDIEDEVEQSAKAAKVFREIMSAPDKAIPQSILDDADCVAVFPSVIKAAFGVGGTGGRGVVSCRGTNGWSAPAFLNLGGGSFGAQIGVEATDYVMLFMDTQSAKSLLSSNFKIGGNVSAAAGPVGREAAAATDAKMNAKLLSYSRSKGLFAGAAIDGAVIEAANKDMRDAYGEGASASAVLFGGKTAREFSAFPSALAEYSGKK